MENVDHTGGNTDKPKIVLLACPRGWDALPTAVYKALLIGPPNVGKTSLVRRFTQDEFHETYTSTVAAEIRVHAFELPEGRVVLTMVDIGGQQSFLSLRNRFYEGAHYIVLVYDMTDRSTFDVMPTWYSALADTACVATCGPIGGSLVANKCDMRDRRAVSEAEGRALAKMLHFDYFETSAKTGECVAEVFLNAAASAREHFRTS